MVYCKESTYDYLLALCSSIGNDMLYKDESGAYPYANTLNWHMFCLTLGTAYSIKLSKKDYISLPTEVRAAFKGIFFDKYSIRDFWNSNHVYKSLKLMITGSDKSYDYGDYVGIFELISCVLSGSIPECRDSMDAFKNIDESALRTMWSIIEITIKDEFTKIMLGQHINELLNYKSSGSRDNGNPIKSMMCFSIAAAFSYSAKNYKDYVLRILLPRDEADRFNTLYKDWISFLSENGDYSLFDSVVPKPSEVALNKLFGASNNPSSVEKQVIDTSIGDDLKESIKSYLANGGNPGQLISWINKIS